MSKDRYQPETSDVTDESEEPLDMDIDETIMSTVSVQGKRTATSSSTLSTSTLKRSRTLALHIGIDCSNGLELSPVPSKPSSRLLSSPLLSSTRINGPIETETATHLKVTRRKSMSDLTLIKMGFARRNSLPTFHSRREILIKSESHYDNKLRYRYQAGPDDPKFIISHCNDDEIGYDFLESHMNWVKFDNIMGALVNTTRVQPNQILYAFRAMPWCIDGQHIESDRMIVISPQNNITEAYTNFNNNIGTYLVVDGDDSILKLLRSETDAGRNVTFYACFSRDSDNRKFAIIYVLAMFEMLPGCILRYR